MYGDNRNIILVGLSAFLVILLFTLSLVSLVKVGRLEKQLNSTARISAAEDNTEVQKKDSLSEESSVSEETAFYNGVDYWLNHVEKQKEAEKLKVDFPEDDWSFLSDLQLTVNETSTISAWSLEKHSGSGVISFFTLTYNGKDWTLRSRDGGVKDFSRVNGSVEQFVIDHEKIQQDQLNFTDETSHLYQTLLNDKSFKALLVQKDCRVVLDGDKENLTGIRILTDEDRLVLSSNLEDGRRLINEEPFTGDSKEFFQAVFSELDKADTRSKEIILQSQSLALIQSMYGDKAFSQYLKKQGLYPQWTIRQDDDFSYIDLVDESGVFQAAFAVKHRTGQIYLVDSDEVPLISLDSLKTQMTQQPQEGDVRLPDDLEAIDDIYSASESFTILLVGYHNSGTDTMILAHVDRPSGEITMISIPRDLWWEGQKINSYYFGSSREKLLALMTEITGIKVDYYLSIDMYAFIDVVNAMGGIDVTLDKSVIDPTYKVVREDGSEGTLNYPAGDYHLNGVEALRLARSRHGSSDFDRSVLQQTIISSMKVRLRQLSLKDMGTLRQFFQIAHSHIETNMSLPFMVKNLLECRDYQFDAGHTLNSEDTIYNTYSNFYNLSAGEKEKARNDDDFQWGQWILLPLNNDWNLIRYKVRQVIN